MALVCSILFVACDLADGALKTLHMQSYKTASEQAAQVALQRVVADSVEAVNITTGPSSYSITKIDPSVPLAIRFPPAPATWSPVTYLCNITYQLTGTTLYRTITSYANSVAVAGETSNLPVAYGINTFASANPTVNGDNCTVQISITIQEQDLVRVLNVTVWLPTSNP